MQLWHQWVTIKYVLYCTIWKKNVLLGHYKLYTLLIWSKIPPASLVIQYISDLSMLRIRRALEPCGRIILLFTTHSMIYSQSDPHSVCMSHWLNELAASWSSEWTQCVVSTIFKKVFYCTIFSLFSENLIYFLCFHALTQRNTANSSESVNSLSINHWLLRFATQW
jgi:hypothetical protein